MTPTPHWFPDRGAIGARIQLTEQNNVTSSKAAMTSLAENHRGLPFQRTDFPARPIGRAPRRKSVRLDGLSASATLVGLSPGRFGTLGLLRRGGLALHLLLRILGRGRHVVSRAVHRAGRRMLSGISTHAGGLTAVTHGRSGPCVLVRGPAGGIARSGLRRS
jgi:hypothetical protein